MQIIDLIGTATTIFGIVVFLVILVGCVNGFVPVLYRLGMGLWRRKIAVFAKGDALGSLQILLSRTRLFKAKNVLPVTSVGDFGESDRASVLLVYWPDWVNEIDQIITLKKDHVALIIYAPQEKGFLPKEVVAKLEQQRNVVLTNFRGRLLNDLLTSMITTGYEKD